MSIKNAVLKVYPKLVNLMFIISLLSSIVFTFVSVAFPPAGASVLVSLWGGLIMVAFVFISFGFIYLVMDIRDRLSGIQDRLDVEHPTNPESGRKERQCAI